MGYSSFLRSHTNEEQEVPDSIDTQFLDIKEQPYANKGDIDIMDEIEGIWSVNNEDEEQKLASYHSSRSQVTWEFMVWEEFANGDDEEDRDKLLQIELARNILEDLESERHDKKLDVKREILSFWDEDENRVSLNLSLNYQQVLDAWSDRGSLWADDISSSRASHCNYMGEVPVMEEDRRRRKASVLRYKEKRQSRLFSKKIRYQVRKLNADKRPRFKGRFVKRVG